MSVWEHQTATSDMEKSVVHIIHLHEHENSHPVLATVVLESAVRLIQSLDLQKHYYYPWLLRYSTTSEDEHYLLQQFADEVQTQLSQHHPGSKGQNHF